MRKLFLFTVLAAASFSVAAQQDKQPQQDAQKAEQKPAQSTISEERVRVDGAAGGTAPLPEDKRKGVGAGAGPHLRDNLPSPTKLPRDKPVEPPK